MLWVLWWRIYNYPKKNSSLSSPLLYYQPSLVLASVYTWILVWFSLNWPDSISICLIPFQLDWFHFNLFGSIPIGLIPFQFVWFHSNWPDSISICLIPLQFVWFNFKLKVSPGFQHNKCSSKTRVRRLLLSPFEMFVKKIKFCCLFVFQTNLKTPGRVVFCWSLHKSFHEYQHCVFLDLQIQLVLKDLPMPQQLLILNWSKWWIDKNSELVKIENGYVRRIVQTSMLYFSRACILSIITGTQGVIQESKTYLRIVLDHPF